MGSEAAIAYQLMSGLAGGAGTLMASGVKPVLPNAGTYSASQSLQQSAIDTEVKAEQDQANLAVSEGQLELQRQGYEGSYITSQIAQQYNDAGVSGQTPMLMVNQARIAKQNEIQAYGLQQAATANLLNQKAFITGAEGRAKLASGNADFITKLAAAQMAGDTESSKLRSSAFGDFSSVLGKAAGINWNTFGNNTGSKKVLNYGSTPSVKPGSTSTYGGI